MEILQNLISVYPDIDIRQNEGSDSYRADLPIDERDAVAVVIKHPTENSYLISKSKKITWNGLLIGGIEKGDTPEETVKKEIHEETGYRNITRIVPMSFITHSLFFHPVKNVNRLAHYHLYFTELSDLEKDEVPEEEASINDFVWVPYGDVLGKITRKGIKLLWEFYMNNKEI